jgi:hypothetical protein
MFQAILDIWTSWANPEPVRGMCFLPAPVTAAKAKAKSPKVDSTMFEIDKEKNFYGFYHNGASERSGAVPALTDWDMEVLEDRDLTGGEKVTALNERCKHLWYAGEKQEDVERIMGRSDSWVEKRYFAFAAALSNERGDAVE